MGYGGDIFASNCSFSAPRSPCGGHGPVLVGLRAICKSRKSHYDGVPFLMHDQTLRRTTNVEEVFPELAYDHSSMFNWTDLERLNAGKWFLKNDPFWTVSSLSPADFVKAANQSVCKLTEMLETIKDNTTVLLNLQDLPEDHPYYATSVNVTLDTILTSGIPQQAVMWLPNLDRHLVQEIAPGFQQTCGQKTDAQRLRDRGFQKLNLRYTQVTREDIREYASANLSVNLYIVNEPWLYSLLWCMGVKSITSDNSQVLLRLPSPLADGKWIYRLYFRNIPFQANGYPISP
ncbi:hypothetical protein E2320_005743 [Naja naja]|nr:hypothetical protein E2320_005743 [Naja naja]